MRRHPSTWTCSFDIKDQEIDVAGVLWLIDGALAITMTRDRHADCDADGRRGRDVTYEDERRWTLISAAKCGADGEWEPTLKGDAIPGDVAPAAETWADAYDPSELGAPDEDEGPDREDDDR